MNLLFSTTRQENSLLLWKIPMSSIEESRLVFVWTFTTIGTRTLRYGDLV